MPTTLSSTNITAVQFKESASPGTPSSGYGRVWVYTDGALHYINDAGTNIDVSALYTGGLALASQAVGDLIYASSATQLGRIADVAIHQVLVSGGVGVVPAWSATPTLTTVTAALTGNVTGNCSGSSGSCTGNAATATSAGTCTGNAATATALATPRAINGVNFDGSAPITVTAAAGTLTGTTLVATVVTSSLTAVGTTTSGVWNAGAVTSSGAITGTIGDFSGAVDSAGDFSVATTKFTVAAASGNTTLAGTLGLGVTPTIGKLQIASASGATFTTIPANTSAFGYISSTTGWAGQGFLFSGAGTNDGFGLVYGGGVAYFGKLTNAAQTPLLSLDGTNNIFYHSLKIGGSAVRGTTTGTNRLDLFDGTAPVGTLTNGVSIYSSVGECYIMDAAGNATLQSPHDADTGEWIFFSKNTVTGRVVRVAMERLVAEVERLSGKTFAETWVE